MKDLVRTTYDVYAEDACGWLIAHEERLPDMAFVEAYVKLFREHDPYKIYVEKRETYCVYSEEKREEMRKEKTDTTLTFYDVELHATPAEYYECLHIEDPDITEDYSVEKPKEVFYHLPYQDSDVKWETGNGVLRMFGKITHPSKINIKLIHKDVIMKGEK